jgi:son of sevenless-like protein
LRTRDTDTDLVATFLLTYRSFTTPEELLHFIVRRYEITPPADLDKEGLRLWEASEMLPIRLRYHSPLLFSLLRLS